MYTWFCGARWVQKDNGHHVLYHKFVWLSAPKHTYIKYCQTLMTIQFECGEMWKAEIDSMQQTHIQIA